MLQFSSGAGTPEVVQDSSKFSPSFTLVLDGLSVAMGTSTHNQGEGRKQSGYWKGKKKEEGGAEMKKGKLRIHDHLLSLQLKYKARKNLNKTSEKAGNTHIHRWVKVKRKTHKNPKFNLPVYQSFLSCFVEAHSHQLNSKTKKKQSSNTAMVTPITSACLRLNWLDTVWSLCQSEDTDYSVCLCLRVPAMCVRWPECHRWDSVSTLPLLPPVKWQKGKDNKWRKEKRSIECRRLIQIKLVWFLINSSLLPLLHPVLSIVKILISWVTHLSLRQLIQSAWAAVKTISFHWQARHLISTTNLNWLWVIQLFTGIVTLCWSQPTNNIYLS